MFDFKTVKCLFLNIFIQILIASMLSMNYGQFKRTKKTHHFSQILNQTLLKSNCIVRQQLIVFAETIKSDDNSRRLGVNFKLPLVCFDCKLIARIDSQIVLNFHFSKLH